MERDRPAIHPAEMKTKFSLSSMTNAHSLPIDSLDFSLLGESPAQWVSNKLNGKLRFHHQKRLVLSPTSRPFITSNY
jgi:hypothetical protein